MGTSENDVPSISTDAARASVRGRHELSWGLTGIIAAFAAIGIYAFAPYAAIVVVGAIGAGLLLGLWNILWGYDENASQIGMRIRVVTQFAVICVIMAIVYLSAK